MQTSCGLTFLSLITGVSQFAKALQGGGVLMSVTPVRQSQRGREE